MAQNSNRFPNFVFSYNTRAAYRELGLNFVLFIIDSFSQNQGKLLPLKDSTYSTVASNFLISLAIILT